MQSPAGLRVVLADDSMLIRDGLQRLLHEHGVETVGLASSGTEALIAVRRSRPDIVVLDVRMPPSYTNEGVLAAEAIRHDAPGVGILVLAQNAERTHVERLLRTTQRGIGYLLKNRVAHWDELADALCRIAAGGTAIDPTVVDMLTRARALGPNSSLDELSDRERTVLALMAEGLSNRAVAARMNVGVRTVETHVAAVFAKLDLEERDSGNRRVMAVLEYLRVRDGSASAGPSHSSG
jgi:serine/threonine-protein kinase